MSVTLKKARRQIMRSGLLDPLENNEGRRLRFDVSEGSLREKGSVVARIKDAYTIGRGRTGRLDKVVLKVCMETVRGHRMHSIALDLKTGRWTLYIREGYEHPAYTEGSVVFVDTDSAEPEIDHPRVNGIIHAAQLPASLSLLLGAPFRFYVPSREAGGHYLAGQVESAEISESSTYLHVVAPPFLKASIVGISWSRVNKWEIELEQNGTVSTMRGELELDLTQAIAEAQVVRIA